MKDNILIVIGAIIIAAAFAFLAYAAMTYWPF